MNKSARVFQVRTCSQRLRRWGAMGGENGGALIETAFAVPLLLLLLLGAAEFGMADYESIEVANAARAGAQYGAQGPETVGDLTGIRNAASLDAGNITLGLTTSALSYICSDTSNPTGTPLSCASGATMETILTVKTQAAFNPVIHVPGFGGSIALHGSASEKVSQ
jgi:Flp pilus assembly protein TadG